MTTFYITPKKDEAGQTVFSGYYCIPASEEVEIPVNQQSITIGCLDIEGCLDVSGQLYIIDC